MTVILLIVLIAVPLLEIAVMIKVGSLIGFWPALAIVVGTFVLGASVLAQSGLAAAFRVQEAMLKGEAPVHAMLEGALLAVAGILLATPGFIADFCGLVLLVPPVRRAVALWALRSVFVETEIRAGGAGFDRSGERTAGRSPGEDGTAGAGPVIDGEFERLDERPLRPDERPSPRGNGRGNAGSG